MVALKTREKELNSQVRSLKSLANTTPKSERNCLDFKKKL